MDYAANLAFFLQQHTGSVCGVWRGHMLAKQQRELFGRFLGKGLIGINGGTERIVHSRKVCFGTDFEITHDLSWREVQ